MGKWLAKSLIIVSVLVSVLVPWRIADAEHQVLRLKDRQVITFEKMIDEVRKSQVVLIGEGHNFPWHHELQLEVIRTLKREGANMAVGLEMFQARSQDVLDRWSSGSMDDRTFIPQYYANWNMPWPLYKDIFLFVRERRIPSIGLNVPMHISRKVASKGFDSLSPEELRELPPGIACDLDPEYMEYVKKVYRSHKAHGKREFQYFCEAQVLWEQAMAWYIRKYLNDNPHRMVVVLAGINHAMKPGIPRQLGRDGKPPLIAVIVPEIPGDDRGVPDISRADYLIFSHQAQAAQ